MTTPKATLYTDGAFYGHAKNQPGGWAALTMQDGQMNRPQIITGGVQLADNSERMELRAMVEGLLALGTSHHVDLFTDNKSIAETIGEYNEAGKKGKARIREYFQKPYNGNTKSRFINRDLYDRLFNQLDFHEVSAKWIRGHENNPWNILADSKAAAAAQQLRIDDGEVSPPPQGRVAVYIAGSLEAEGKNSAGGWVAVTHARGGKPQQYSGAQMGVTRVKHMEIIALTNALAKLPEGSVVDVYCKNSQLCKDIRGVQDGTLPYSMRRIMEQEDTIYQPLLAQLDRHEVAMQLISEKDKDPRKCLAEEEARALASQMRVCYADHSAMTRRFVEGNYGEAAQTGRNGWKSRR